MIILTTNEIKTKNMKTTNLLRFGAIALVFALSFQSCKKDEDKNQEFIADDNTFKDFRTWTLKASNNGPDPALGPAHAGNDSTVTRDIYFDNNVSASGGQYPVGALIVKESKNPDMSVQELTAMAKRGNDFNTAAGDWEWFILNSDGSIAVDNNGDQIRGASLFNGMCVNCHNQAATSDFVFTQ